MLVIFTIAKGKIPTYFIQAHPAMAILASHFLVTASPEKKWSGILVHGLLLIPALIAIAGSIMLIVVFELNALLFTIPILAAIAIGIPYMMSRNNSRRKMLFFLQPFSGAYAILLIMAVGVMPQLEQFRPYDQIGAAIKSIPSLSRDLPIYLQDGKLHNLPYYAERKMIYDADQQPFNSGKVRFSDYCKARILYRKMKKTSSGPAGSIVNEAVNRGF